jgi:hypothetical protein
MSWRGTVRSINAAIRAAERDAKRRQRELQRQAKEIAKMEELDRAAHEVAAHENQLALLTSVHLQHNEEVDWSSMASDSAPNQPDRHRIEENQARQTLKQYKPSLIDRTFGREAKQREKLRNNLDIAIESDEAQYNEALKKYQSDYIDWKQTTELAKRVIAGEGKALIEAVEQLDPFSDISELGAEITLTVPDRHFVDVEVKIHSSEIIPTESKSLLQSGKLSVKRMPKGQFFELYQDYVCSCVWRIATEIHAILPVEGAIISAKDELLNTATGHIELTPILSVYVPRKTLQRINLERIDPSDALTNFVHNMLFQKTKGFEPVQKVDLAKILDRV